MRRVRAEICAPHIWHRDDVKRFFTFVQNDPGVKRFFANAQNDPRVKRFFALLRMTIVEKAFRMTKKTIKRL